MRRRDFLSASLHLSAGLTAASFLGIKDTVAEPCCSYRTRRPVILLGTRIDVPVITALKKAMARIGVRPQAEIELMPLTSFDPQALQRDLRHWHGARLVCLMDQGTHIVLDESLRDLGSRMVCTGTHRCDPRSAGTTRHHFLTAHDATGIGNVMAGVLAANGDDFHITESSLSESGQRDEGQICAMSPNSWPIALGSVLAMVAAGTWQPMKTVPTIQSRATVSDGFGTFFTSLVTDI